MKNGVLVIDKPAEYTSFDVVAVLRKLLSERHIGHSGTLDPMATGVLVVLLGRDTKAIPYLENSGKRYRAGFRLGMETDTQDSTGTVLKNEPCVLRREAVEAALGAFCGEIEQIPPMYSAVFADGRRLYDLARKGIVVERKPRKVTVYSLRLTAFEEETGQGELLIECSKGTYIRTLCADLGAALGVGAVMTSLRREETSFCDLSMAITLDQARALASSGELEARLFPVERLLLGYPEARLTKKQTYRFLTGNFPPLSGISLEKPAHEGLLCRVYSDRGEFLGLGRCDVEKGRFAIEKLFQYY